MIKPEIAALNAKVEAFAHASARRDVAAVSTRRSETTTVVALADEFEVMALEILNRPGGKLTHAAVAKGLETVRRIRDEARAELG